MRRDVFAVLLAFIFTVGATPGHVVEPDPVAELQPSNFAHQLGGYYGAGSKIIDEDATGGFAQSSNFPRKIDDSIKNQKEEVYLLALADSATAFGHTYKGMELRLINGTEKQQDFGASDGRLFIIQEALDETGEWKPVEYLPSSWCGNSYHHVFLGPGEHWLFPTPKYEGAFSTTLRFSMSIGDDKVIHSNEFKGSVNPVQFEENEDMALWR